MALRVAPGCTLSWSRIMGRVLAQSHRSRLAQILDWDVEPFDLVVLAANVLGLGFNEDADAGQGLAGFSKFVLDQSDRLGFARDVDGNALLAAAIDDAVAFNTVS